jgi:ketopantoate reductase
MDKLTRYGELIQDILREYASYKPSYGQIEVEVVVDPSQGHFELIYVGWNGQQRVHGCTVHLDIRDGKIWIQHDGTEEGIANRLVEAGVPKSDIFLGFQTPFQRRCTEFAVG